MMDLDDESMEAYMKNNKNFGNPITLTINLDDSSNIAQAYKIFNNVVIKCPTQHFGGRTNRRKTNRRKTNRRKTNRRKTNKIKNK
jgi:cytochrome oxidase Cu insertion factor (SCO1/SenC/PrrC family)